MKISLKLHLQNDPHISGRILKVNHDEKIPILKTSSNMSEKVVYLPYAFISYLHLRNPPHSLMSLSNGSALRNNEGKMPGILAIRRITEETFRNSLPRVEVEFSPDFSDLARFNMSDFIKGLKFSLERIKSDKIGKDALGNITKILVKGINEGEIKISGPEREN